MPPLAMALAVPLLIMQPVGAELDVIAGIFPPDATVTVPVVMQPLASDTVTVQLPADSPVAVDVVCPLHQW